MIKQQFETENQSISFWIDEDSGALCVQSCHRDVMEIPLNTGMELLNTLRQKQAEYLEANRKGIFKWIG
jgi:hypothetical protein